MNTFRLYLSTGNLEYKTQLAMEKQVNFFKRQPSHLFQNSHPFSQVIITELTFYVIRK